MAHTYTVDVTTTEGLQGESVPRDVERSVPFAAPPEFGGPGGRWTPEHFLAAAVNSCVALTFLSAAQQSKLTVASYESSATATMDKTADGLRITTVELRPRIKVTSESDRERAEKMIRKAESFCPISNSLTAEVKLEANIEVG